LATLLLAGGDPGSKPEGVPEPDQSAWPENPVAILVEQDPWAMVIGADLPVVEVYSDGTVLRADPSNRADRSFLVSQLKADGSRRLLQAIGPTKAFTALDEFYNLLPNVTDQPTTQLVIFDGAHAKSVSVYGYSLGTVDKPAYTVFGHRSKAEKLPSEFDRVARLLASLAPKNEQPWQPRYVEVMLWPYEHSPEEPMAWPKGWPSADSPLVFPRRHSYSVIVPGSELPARESTFEQRGDRQAVLWNGHKWPIAYRLVLPASEMAERIAAVAAMQGG
jgi:hypothetical protein